MEPDAHKSKERRGLDEETSEDDSEPENQLVGGEGELVDTLPSHLLNLFIYLFISYFLFIF